MSFLYRGQIVSLYLTKTESNIRKTKFGHEHGDTINLDAIMESLERRDNLDEQKDEGKDKHILYCNMTCDGTLKYKYI